MATLLSSGNYFGTEKQYNDDVLFKLNITQYQPFDDIHEHYHENAYLSLLINGNYQESSRIEESVISPGEILFRPAGYHHANHFMALGGKCLNIELKKELLDIYEQASPVPKMALTYKAGTFEYLYRIMYSFASNTAITLSDEYIFNWLAENASYKIPIRLLWLPKVKAILENEFGNHHTLNSIANRVFVHPIYLARAFKEREGLTIGEYQLKMRVKKAMQLLFNTNIPIVEIAFLAGFTDATHLIRSFRLYYQVTPAKFRLALKS
ncbi:helix-turn-helix transcriptional regulator [Mucilaginibacter sp. SP1R1]|uniref:helix-turn-helix transcriptional regulator n=1 Tax=Mucilaginibacter sp. SP1R1 TaxID=2723091 RepID=UPI001613691F|nr:helix-turn-helix transcriptional regulator [Mucilaginibacter sp. SP1R1]MBB6147952.1 AraC-like DNA-binding protein [Mucilaginibacter sp. SP1R1]